MATKKAATTDTTKKTAAKASAEKAKAPKAGAEKLSVEEGIVVGDKAPSFSLFDQEGNKVSSAQLKGKSYVLYFYPKDNTPGCTQEACDFRDSWSRFQKTGTLVFGVSPDSQKSHEGFASKFELSFSLLADPDKELATSYGVWALKKNYGREYWGIVRSTFLIGTDGKVKQVWRNVKVKGHVEEVLAASKELA